MCAIRFEGLKINRLLIF